LADHQTKVNSMTERIGIVVPTIGGRPEYLPLALASIRAAVAKPEDVYILMVGRAGFDAAPYRDLIDEYVDEPESGLAAKINFGFRSLPADIRFINWLGDDDLLTPGSLTAALERALQPDEPVLVYGGCEYIDPAGVPIWNNASGPWAVGLLRFGPQLIPQPGALYRRDAFERIGGLSTKFGWAFDFELFYSLSEIGRCAYLPMTLAQFRWHPGSLSVSRRRESVAEASAVRKAHHPAWMRSRVFSWVSEIWEWPVRQATYWAGVRVSRKLK
jgi:GT2 family glycosyltransferase